MQTDRIEKQIVLPVPIERAWSAIGDSDAFGRWFGMAVDGPFVAGATMKARIVPTTVDAEVAKLQQPHAGTPFEIVVERVEPPRLLAFRWHPYGAGAGDLASEPMTLVEFRLEAVPGGTRVTIAESGFDRIPVARRAQAFKANEGGWEMQAKLIAKYVAARA